MKKTKNSTVSKWSVLTFIILLSVTSLSAQKEQRMSVAAPKGILVFTGMELANNNKISAYNVERSTNKNNWEKIAELKSPTDAELFYANYNKWNDDFGFQGTPLKNELINRWQKCLKASVIDSMRYMASLTSVRLAAGLAFYDQNAPKNSSVWYKISSLDRTGKILTSYLSSPVQWPYQPAYDDVSLTEKNMDKKLFYLKWESDGKYPAPAFIVSYYENGKMYTAKGTQASYAVEGKRFYVFQDSTRYLRTDRQYFMNPTDIYGNKAPGSDIVIVSAVSALKSFFVKTNAKSDPKSIGVILNWKIKNAAKADNIKIFRSDSYDGKEYQLLTTIPAKDTIYTDRSTIPDKIYYYYLLAGNEQNAESIKSNIFFNAAYDLLKPVYPIIKKGKDVKGGVQVKIETSDMNLAGVKIYRNDGISKQLYPISDMLKLQKNTINYVDTSRILSGDRSYLYAAKAVNNSGVESDFSDTLILHPTIITSPPSPNRISAYVENNQVNLVWEDVRTRYKGTHGYNIVRREAGKGDFTLISSKDSVVTIPLFSDKSALPGKSYEYGVQTVDDFNSKSESMALTSIYIKPDEMPVPPTIWLTQEAATVIIQWAEATTKSQATNINLYRYQRNSKPVLLKKLSLNERKYTDNNVKKGGLYFYYTTYVNGNNNEGTPSQEKEIRIKN